MSESFHGNTLNERIVALRKQKSLTQEQLAERLGITFQAVSKWENGNSCPDIGLLPRLAEEFGVTLDTLFGREAPEAETSQTIGDVPWHEDGKLRAVIYIGKTLVMKPVEGCGKFTFEYKGEALDIVTYFPISCGDVDGDISATNANVNCGDIGGDVSANGSVTCADVGGDISANGSVTCADVSGDISASGSVTAADINGDVKTSGNVAAAQIGGDVSANIIKCKIINGDVECEKREPYEESH